MQPSPFALRAPDPQISVRPVQLSDLDSLYYDCWPDRPYIAVYNVVTRAIRHKAEERGLGVVVQGMGDKVCGFGQVAIWPTCAEISDMIIAKPYRGRGFGTAIIQTLAREALGLGAEELEIGAAVENGRAAALYRRLGFADSHTLMLNLGVGKEHVLFLRMRLHEEQPASVEAD